MDDHGDEPVVSIIGINRAVELPMVYDGANAVRRMMNLSSSFDGCGILQRKSDNLRWIQNALFKHVTEFTGRRVISVGTLAGFDLVQDDRYIPPAFSTIFRKGSSIERARIRIPAV